MLLDEDLISIVNRSIWSEVSVGLFTVNTPLGNNVLLSSGVHPEEEATSISVKNIMNDSSFIKSLSNIKLYVVPCRNSIGNNLNSVLIENDTTEYISDSIGKMLIFKDIVLFIPSNRCIQKGTLFMFEYIQQLLYRVSFVGFVNIVSMRKTQSLCSNTYFFNKTSFIDLNAINEDLDKTFAHSINNLHKLCSPKIHIDVHEGLGDAAYIYTNEKDDLLLNIARNVISHCISKHIPIRAEASDRIKIEDGIYSISSLNSFKKSSYPIILIEGGIDGKWERRIDVLESIVRNCLMNINEYYGKAFDNTFDQ